MALVVDAGKFWEKGERSDIDLAFSCSLPSLLKTQGHLHIVCTEKCLYTCSEFSKRVQLKTACLPLVTGKEGAIEEKLASGSILGAKH